MNSIHMRKYWVDLCLLNTVIIEDNRSAVSLLHAAAGLPLVSQASHKVSLQKLLMPVNKLIKYQQKIRKFKINIEITFQICINILQVANCCLRKKLVPLNSKEYEGIPSDCNTIPEIKKNNAAVAVLFELAIIVFHALKWILFCRHWRCVFYACTTIKYMRKPWGAQQCSQ